MFHNLNLVVSFYVHRFRCAVWAVRSVDGHSAQTCELSCGTCVVMISTGSHVVKYLHLNTSEDETPVGCHAAPLSRFGATCGSDGGPDCLLVRGLRFFVRFASRRPLRAPWFRARSEGLGFALGRLPRRLRSLWLGCALIASFPCVLASRSVVRLAASVRCALASRSSPGSLCLGCL